ncbi:MAG: FkbM family methyltransferase [Ahrensia sp.]|nr:FkbM family methyltransferase [Ahrensia sp.]
MSVRSKLRRVTAGLKRRIRPPVYPTTRRPHRDLAEFCAYLSHRNLAPSTVIDVGAGSGTVEWPQAFPEAHHIFIEPNPQLEERMEALTKKHRGEHHLVALSEVVGSRSMHVPEDAVQKTGLVLPDDAVTIDVQVETLDGLIGGRELARPILLKTDCQWHDLQLLQGACNTLKWLDVVVVESATFRRYQDRPSPPLGDIVCWMREKGFAVFDIISYQTRPFDDALGRVDLVFAPENGPLRKHHRWA